MKKLILFLFGILAASSAAAISVNNTPVSGSVPSGTTLTFTATSGTGDDRIMIVAGNMNMPGGSGNVSSIEWDGLTFNTARNDINAFTGATVRNFIFYYYLGSNYSGVTDNVTITVSTSTSMNGGAIEYAGVDPVNPIGTSNFDGHDSYSSVIDYVTTTYANSLLFVNNFAGLSSGRTLNPSSNATQRWNIGVNNFLNLVQDIATTDVAVYGVTTTVSGGTEAGLLQQYIELIELQPTPTPTITPTFTVSPTPTWTPTVTATATPSATATATPSATATATGTSTATPSATPNWTPTSTPACTYIGNTVLGPLTSGAGFVNYKSVTLSNAGTISDINVYVESTPGRIQTAIYNDLHGNPWLLQTTSSIYSASSGWNDIPISSGILPAGDYWLAVEVNSSAKVTFRRVGPDKFGYATFSTWASPATVQNILGNLAVYGYYCHF